MILRNPDRSSYTKISNSTLDDSRLSFGARGILCYLLSKPDGWQVRYFDLKKNGNCGEHVVRKYMRELVQHGYAQMKKRPKYNEDGNPNGQWDGTEVLIFETPVSVPI